MSFICKACRRKRSSTEGASDCFPDICDTCYAILSRADVAEHHQSLAEKYREIKRLQLVATRPIPMLLVCPCCGWRHIDEGEWAAKVHGSHACANCGTIWRPALVPTVGVKFLPGTQPKE